MPDNFNVLNSLVKCVKLLKSVTNEPNILIKDLESAIKLATLFANDYKFTLNIISLIALDPSTSTNLKKYLNSFLLKRDPKWKSLKL